MAATDRAGRPSAAPPIERLAPDDAEVLCALSIEAGWNQVAADWRLMLSLGQGFGVKGEEGRWVASALALPLGPHISWISMLLVTGPARGQGLGTRLLSRCVEEVEATDRCAGLDATELGRPIYHTRGFHDLLALSRWVIGAGARDAVAPPPDVTIRTAGVADAARVADYDYPRSGFERGAILAHLLERAPALARIAEDEDGSIAGYALGRDGHRAMHVGPVVARDDAVGLALLSSAMGATEGPLIADVPDGHARVRRWLEEQGGSVPRGYVRMLRGDSAPIGDPARVFAVAGPELA
jgi:GNAT superfamily N-acetyltransferase